MKTALSIGPSTLRISISTVDAALAWFTPVNAIAALAQEGVRHLRLLPVPSNTQYRHDFHLEQGPESTPALRHPLVYTFFGISSREILDPSEITYAKPATGWVGFRDRRLGKGNLEFQPSKTSATVQFIVH